MNAFRFVCPVRRFAAGAVATAAAFAFAAGVFGTAADARVATMAGTERANAESAVVVAMQVAPIRR